MPTLLRGSGHTRRSAGISGDRPVNGSGDVARRLTRRAKQRHDAIIADRVIDKIAADPIEGQSDRRTIYRQASPTNLILELPAHIPVAKLLLDRNEQALAAAALLPQTTDGTLLVRVVHAAAG